MNAENRGGREVKKSILWIAAAAALLAFFAQALWESPFVSFVWYPTFLGGWAAWHLSRPIDVNKASIWRFDIIAIAINATLYFIVMIAARNLTIRCVKR